MEYKSVFGLLSIIIAVIGYIPYLRDIFRHKTHPHAFSWLVWAVLSGIGFGIQVTHNAGAGAWLLGFSAGITFAIFLLSFRYGEKEISRADWVCLSFAGIALVLWAVVKQPLLSILLIALVDGIGGFAPTFRKSFHKPEEETAILYILYAVSLVFSLLALDEFTFLNAFYPASFVGINLAMAIFLRVRRQTMAKQ